MDEQGCPGDAVDIKVSVDSDFLSGKQSPIDSGCCLVYIGQEEGVAGEAFIAGEERSYSGRLSDAAIIQKLGYQWGES